MSPDLRSLSNHAPLSVSIIIEEEFVQERKQTIVKNSKEENEFIKELKVQIGDIDTTNILNSDLLECLTQEFTFIAENLWNKYFKQTNITKHLKAW